MDGGTKTISHGRRPHYVRRPGEIVDHDVRPPNVWSRIAIRCVACNRRSYLVARHGRPGGNSADSGGPACAADRDGVDGEAPHTVCRDNGSTDFGEDEVIVIETPHKYTLTIAVGANLVLIVFMLLQLRVTPSQVLEEIKTQNRAMDLNTTRLSTEIARISHDLGSLKLTSVATDDVVSKIIAEAMQKEQFRKWSIKAKELNPQLNIPQLEELEGVTHDGQNGTPPKADKIAYVVDATRVSVVTPAGREVSWWTWEDATGHNDGGDGLSDLSGCTRSGSDRGGCRIGPVDGPRSGPDAMPNGRHLSGERF